MEGGFIITSSQADAYSKDQPMTMKIRWRNDSNVKEKIFFSLYRREGVTYVIAEKNDDLSEFIQTGNLYDLRHKGVDPNSSGSRFYDLVKSIHFSLSERIRRCNVLRDVLYAKTKMRIRCCGPELESLLNRKIYSRCHEMVGMCSEGTYFSMENVLHEKRYVVKVDDNLRDFECIDRSTLDLGQKKLAALFDGFVMARDVIYIGSSPGDAWLSLLDKYPTITVYSFDPRPLSNDHPRVKHFKMVVYSVEDILPFLDKDKHYDLIWDVRGDYVDDSSYKNMIKREIEIVNDLLVIGRLPIIRINVKIHVDLLENYFLYEKGRFFLLPYILERDMKELRYVSRIGLQVNFSSLVCNELRMWLGRVTDAFQKDERILTPLELKMKMTTVDYVYSNYNLYLNSKLMRLDIADFIEEPRIDSDIDLNLYSINRNSSLQMLKYFEQRYPVVCTYFCKDDLNEDENMLIDYECLDFLKYSIYDSRLFIRQMIPGLRIICPKILGPMANELLSSESFRLQQSYDQILNRFNNCDYINAKADGAKEEGFSYKKFPVPFSLAEEMISVSGHMMRFSYLCLVENDFSFLTYCDKILSNFLINKCVHPKYLQELRKGQVEWFPFELKSCLIEKKSIEFWHSIPEWRSGLRALKFLLDAKYHCKIEKMIQKFNSMCDHFICKDKKGHELYDFMMASGSFRLLNLKSYQGCDLGKIGSVFSLLREHVSQNNDFRYGLAFLEPIKSKSVNTVSLMIKCFYVDAAVRFVYSVFSFMAVISKDDVLEIRNRYAEIFEWRRLTYLSHVLFHAQLKAESLWTQDDFSFMYSFEPFCLFTMEWNKFDAPWRNDYYYLMRMLILLRNLMSGELSSELNSNWRNTYDADWLTFALRLGLNYDYVSNLVVCNESMDPSLFTLRYDAENLYKSVMRGLIYVTP